ncbi:glutamyl-tRNA reductase [Botryosphaeria dothidea]|uniref:Glutamyl-tRNA reductase n=1 Tax=Botryosphaeria dothidea TaxID=55169 RepID=A0A8H4N7X7_9PEZI|nr:glutamyl-tRNA reductase [Botryosphaeria dothidea]
MSTNNNTVVSLKSSFLRTQTRILSQPLQAPERWKASNISASDIPESVIKDALREVNRQVRRYNKSAYPSLAIRHVADQIDALYWAAGAPPLSLPQNVADDQDSLATPVLEPLHPSADLTSSTNIAALAPTWAEAIDREPSQIPERDRDAAERYEEVVQRLQELDERRRLARRKLERYRRLRETVEVLRDPKERVQGNIVTRDGELARCVAEAKTLGVRVSARMAGWAEGREYEGERDKDEEQEWLGRSKDVERKKLTSLLED